MAENLDVRDLSCPLPVIKVKALMDGGAREIEVVGNTPAGRENIIRLAKSRNYHVAAEKMAAGEWKLVLTRES